MRLVENSVDGCHLRCFIYEKEGGVRVEERRLVIAHGRTVSIPYEWIDERSLLKLRNKTIEVVDQGSRRLRRGQHFDEIHNDVVQIERCRVGYLDAIEVFITGHISRGTIFELRSRH